MYIKTNVKLLSKRITQQLIVPYRRMFRFMNLFAHYTDTDNCSPKYKNTTYPEIN